MSCRFVELLTKTKKRFPEMEALIRTRHNANPLDKIHSPPNDDTLPSRKAQVAPSLHPSQQTRQLFQTPRHLRLLSIIVLWCDLCPGQVVSFTWLPTFLPTIKWNFAGLRLALVP
jgi:hypothetical protein